MKNLLSIILCLGIICTAKAQSTDELKSKIIERVEAHAGDLTQLSDAI